VYILDTDLFSLSDRLNDHASQRLRFRLSCLCKDELATTIITFEEQTRGWLSWLTQARTFDEQVVRYHQLNRMVRSYRDVLLLDFDQAAVEELKRLQKQRIRIGTMDLKIAAIALAHNATLLSRNLQDFSKITGLQVEDWSAG
jgi:tRNA(fMet)-specific endonuclease VapC